MPHVRVIETPRIVSSYVCLVTGEHIQSMRDVSPTTLHNLSERGLRDLLSFHSRQAIAEVNIYNNINSPHLINNGIERRYF